MLFALGWASGSGLVPVRVGLLWHPWLQRPIMGLCLVRTLLLGLVLGARGVSDTWSCSYVWALGAEWGRGSGRRSPWVVQVGRVCTWHSHLSEVEL